MVIFFILKTLWKMIILKAVKDYQMATYIERTLEKMLMVYSAQA